VKTPHRENLGEVSRIWDEEYRSETRARYSERKAKVKEIKMESKDAGKIMFGELVRMCFMALVIALLGAIALIAVLLFLALLVPDAAAQEVQPVPDWGGGVIRETHKLDFALRIAAPVAIGADLITTERALARGGVELNPLQQNRGVRIATHAGMAMGVDWMARRWERRGERGKSRALRIIVITAYTALAIRNSKVGDK
jgi:hypothetical protein